MFSCTKDWECCTTLKVSGYPDEFASANKTYTNCYDFSGSNKEKDEIENEGTYVSNDTSISTPIYTYTNTSTTICLRR